MDYQVLYNEQLKKNEELQQKNQLLMDRLNRIDAILKEN